MSDRCLTAAIKSEARRLGFDFCRIAAVEEAAHADFLVRWLGLGRAGEMTYMSRHVDKRRSPALLADGGEPFRSLIVLGVDYHSFDLSPQLLGDPSRGVIARYAWGDDYHEIVRPLLFELDGFVRTRTGRQTLGKGLVDTGPVLERDWAHRAGLGFTGKNCCTIHPQRGSWLFLATLLVPEKLARDPVVNLINVPAAGVEGVIEGLPASGAYGSWHLPVSDSNTGTGSEATCGQCTRCLDACPTDAFVGPFHLDPLRCISYWTIESRRPIPRPLRPKFGNRIFGCDVCQEVCPWNQRLAARAPLLKGLEARLERMAPPLLEGFEPGTPYWLEPRAFAERWRRSPLKRAKRAGMLRNVCVALGNWSDPSTFSALQGASMDSSPLARGHAAWALGRLVRRHKDERAVSCLRTLLAREQDTWVREEAALALGADI
ncbi:MAG: DUF1730 domain-containing protein [Caldilineaceae bacterium]|nr:DUF1730 domain-containing protein [Caldilineaceae bacterium]